MFSQYGSEKMNLSSVHFEPLSTRLLAFRSQSKA